MVPYSSEIYLDKLVETLVLCIGMYSLCPMKHISFFFLCGVAVVALSGCADVHNKLNGWATSAANSFDGSGNAMYPYDQSAGIVSDNGSVTVYSIDATSEESYKTYAMNTPGYVVFDPSVTVYSVDGSEGYPGYMPQYDVPPYVQVVKEQVVKHKVLTPMPGEPVMEVQKIEARPRGPYLTTPDGRSGPMLTQ